MGTVVAVSARRGHGLGKTVSLFITLVEGRGVAGDAHFGETMQHLSRLARFADQPNIRQVHLIPSELLDELAGRGFQVSAGELGENILTTGIDLLALPTGARLVFTSGAEVALTGLRNPCKQLEGHTAGLMNALIDRAPDGSLIRRGGVMGVVLTGGDVRAGDAVEVLLPMGEPIPLAPV